LGRLAAAVGLAVSELGAVETVDFESVVAAGYVRKTADGLGPNVAEKQDAAVRRLEDNAAEPMNRQAPIFEFALGHAWKIARELAASTRHLGDIGFAALSDSYFQQALTQPFEA